MFNDVITKVFGTKHLRDIKKTIPVVEEINRIYETLHELPEEGLRAKTEEFKERIRKERERTQQEGQEKGWSKEEMYDRVLEREAEILNEILPEAFALVKEACRRLVGKSWMAARGKVRWDMVPYDVQLVGAVVLHQGKIAEMATGEGKTLVATMPFYLNALLGRGVHLVTVNDYLAQRDAEWMGKIYETLGLSVGCILHTMTPEERRVEYNKDITYGTNNEFGFDYLRDNMAIRPEDQVQRGHHYAIVDEVDSVLVDEARTPLIISGPVSTSTSQKFDELKPEVERLASSQTHLVNQIVSEAEKLLEDGKEYEAGELLLKARRGAPKNKRLMKLYQEVGTQKLITRVENDYLRDKKLHEIDEALYFSIDEKSHVIDLTEKGREVLSDHGGDQDMFVIPDLSTELSQIEGDPQLSVQEKEKKKEEFHRLYSERSERIQNISQLLRAYSLFEKDVEYVVQDGKVLIVDEFTGRLMPGRRYSDGLHQALEAKESVKVEQETQTLATITLQNYFRLYDKLAGMTGTAETEAKEFWDIYKLDVVVIPTNEPVRRLDYEDVIHRTKREKYNAIIEEIEQLYSQKRPVLVGTISVEVSELLSKMLKRRGIPHNVLNAKHHQREAEIVAFAGQPGAVTIATNMAGRGTDIKLGSGIVRHPNCALKDPRPDEEICPYFEELNCRPEVPCGLRIIGTERHEARRIDRQLRGRSGRQGDPGSSRFYLSLEDDLMRLFGSDRIAGVMDRLGVQEGEVITHSMITRSIERAQKRVEMHNFDIRKHLLEYDDVMNQQREVIYDRRAHALTGAREDLEDEIHQMIDEFIETELERHTNGSPHPDDWNWAGLEEDLMKVLLLQTGVYEDEKPTMKPEDLTESIRQKALELMERKKETVGEELMERLERFAILRIIDERWKEHLYEMDQMKEGIGLRAYGQKDPLLEYKKEGFLMFRDMLDRINEEALGFIFKAQFQIERDRARGPQRVTLVHQEAVGLGFQARPQLAEGAPEGEGPPQVGKRVPFRRERAKIGRNDPCPCGSGKKYKYCHGR
ncbi:preprotein translocase subunit SecA [candidate division KSB1 bacterium]|nr:preprotein translocase subunit SecA [candidate division KSB1 bacterium]